MDSLGKTYGGRYKVLGRVGAGGMAEVYRARDELLGRDVALKLLSERFSRDRAFVERFRREAQSAANLNHPNIVSLYDYGSENDEAYFIVMEFIDGRSVAEILRAEGPLLSERAAEITADVAKALGRAHDAGIVHRDIKPGNIMLSSTGQTKVTDFGIARAIGGDEAQTMTQTGMVIGTAAYLSPEQAQGDAVDARSDLYSLGVVLYEMLTGRAPFSGDTPLSIAYKHVREQPQPPSRVNPDVPAALDAIVLKALSKNRDNRYATAQQMQADLERFLSGQPVRATPVLSDATTIAAPPATGTAVIRETAYADDEPEKSRAGWWALSALGILLLFGLLAWLLFSNLIGDEVPQVEVPRVVGMQVEDARDEIEDAGLDAEVVRRASDEEIGEVFRQRPGPGDEVDEGDSVTLFVSTGPAETTVPDLTGLTVEEARAELRAVDLRLGDQTEASSDTFEPGQVIDQDPGPDEEVPEGTRVDVTVSTGEELATVPSVINSTEDSAVDELEAAGFVADVVEAPNADVEPGIVFAQDPGAGEQAAPGSVVVITVSTGPEEQPMPNVTGDEADDAEALLESDYGLQVTQVEEPCADAIPPGSVCRQEPDPGTPVAPGDSATLYVQPGAGAALSPPLPVAVLIWFGALL